MPPILWVPNNLRAHPLLKKRACSPSLGFAILFRQGSGGSGRNDTARQRMLLLPMLRVLLELKNMFENLPLLSLTSGPSLTPVRPSFSPSQLCTVVKELSATHQVLNLAPTCCGSILGIFVKAPNHQELRRRISAAIYGKGQCPLLTFTYPGF